MGGGLQNGSGGETAAAGSEKSADRGRGGETAEGHSVIAREVRWGGAK